MTIEEMREALADALRGCHGLNVDPYLVKRIRTPHAMIDYEIEYDLTMGRGADSYSFTVQVFAQGNDVVQSQKYLDVLRDPANEGSVKQVLEASNAGDYARVRTVGRPQVVSAGEPATEYLMVEFDVEVVA